MNPTLRRLRTPLIFAMVALLLWVQALGLVHRVAHAPGVVRGVAAAPEAQASAAPAQRQANGIRATVLQGPGVQALLPVHDSERGCQLYDQLTHADAAPVAVLSVVQQTAQAVPQATHRASCIAAQAAGFLARGPPAQG